VLGTPAGTLPSTGAKPTTAAPLAPGTTPPAVSLSLKPAVPDGLGGVRRKDPAPKPVATPAAVPFKP